MGTALFLFNAFDLMFLQGCGLVAVYLKLKGNEASLIASDDIRNAGPIPIGCLIEPSVRLKRLKQFRL